MHGMSFRNGVYSSKSFQSDLREIQQLAEEIESGTGSPAKLAARIRDLASDIADDLPRELG